MHGLIQIELFALVVVHGRGPPLVVYLEHVQTLLEEDDQVSFFKLEKVADTVPSRLIELIIALSVVQSVIVLDNGVEDLGDEIWRVHQTLRSQSQMLVVTHIHHFVALQEGPVAIVDLDPIDELIVKDFVVDLCFALVVIVVAACVVFARA